MTHTSPTLDALQRAICAEPWCDTVRLAYADEIEEQQPERAEFIRLQINDHSESKLRLWQLIGEFGPKWLPKFAYDPNNYERDFTVSNNEISFEYRRCDPHAIYRRGFFSEIRCTLGEFMGPKCDRCGGNGNGVHARIVNGEMEIYKDCRPCNGTGTLPGLALTLFNKHPITWVVFSDKEALDNEDVGTYFGEPSGPAYAWYWMKSSSVGIDTQWEIPDEIFAHLKKDQFASEDEADEHLSLAAVNYARSLHGFDPLTQEQA